MSTISVQRNVSLKPYNTMAVPALASHLVEVNSVAQITEAIDFAQRNDLKPLVLGEGSNTLFASDYSGLVILNRLSGIEQIKEHDDYADISVGAGENWHAFVDRCVTEGWFGIENLALIPGLVGAAPIQNIGAYGVEVKDYIRHVDFIDLKTGQLERLSNQQCQFFYRDSIFKHQLRNRVAITAVNFRLSKTAVPNLSYPALKDYCSQTSATSSRQVFDAVCAIRRAKLPSPQDIPNTGSFFKNPIVNAEVHDQLKKDYPPLVSFAAGDKYKLAAGWLIEYCGWKQKAVNGVSVHQHQALVIINPQHQSGKIVLDYAQAIQQDIEAEFGVKLEVEPQIY